MLSGRIKPEEGRRGEFHGRPPGCSLADAQARKGAGFVPHQDRPGLGGGLQSYHKTVAAPWTVAGTAEELGGGLDPGPAGGTMENDGVRHGTSPKRWVR